MARDADIIRTADVCDDYGDELLVCELPFNDYAGRNHFHGEVMTFATYEDNKGMRELLASDGAGKILVVDGRGSRRRALCGGNIAAEALKHRFTVYDQARGIDNPVVAVDDQSSNHDYMDVGGRATHGAVAEVAGGSSPSGRAVVSMV